METNSSAALFQSKPQKNRGGLTKFCKACETQSHDEDNCSMLHLEKFPPRWKLSTKKLQILTISPSKLQLLALTEKTNIENLHMLNSYILARIDNCHFSYLEDV